MILAQTLRPASPPLVWLLGLMLTIPIAASCVNGRLLIADPTQRAVLLLSFSAACAGAVALIAPFSRRRTHRHGRFVVICAVLTSSVIALLGTPVYEPALLGFGAQLCALLLITGQKPLWPVAGGIAIFTIGFVGAAAAGHLPGNTIPSPETSSEWLGIAVSANLTGALIFCCALLWVRMTNTLARRERLLRLRSRRAASQIRQREVELARLHMGAALVDTGVMKAAQELAAPDRPWITPALALDTRVAEATLRDHLRIGVLLHPALDAEILHARRRGVEVLLLGERGRPAADFDEALFVRLASAVREASPGDRVTLRLLDDDSQRALMSVHTAKTSGEQDLRRYSASGYLMSDD